MKKNAQFKKGYSTGTTRRSITLQLTDNGYTAQVRPTTHYAAYVEWGTRFMTAQPFVRPSYQSQKRKFIDDLKRLMK